MCEEDGEEAVVMAARWISCSGGAVGRGGSASARGRSRAGREEREERDGKSGRRKDSGARHLIPHLFSLHVPQMEARLIGQDAMPHLQLAGRGGPILDSHVAAFLPSKGNGKFLKKFVGPVNVWVARKEDKLKVKDEYINYMVCLYVPAVSIHSPLTEMVGVDGCLPALTVQVYQAWLLFLYTSFALQENVLLVNGRDIRPWWIYHHYLAMLMALVSLTWEIKG
uniref:Uncharacterized protein n=2 Tax=Aegilops tauschii subsp. strangulata TaxID=200361 RepID=A0A453GFX6_AEGTS